MTEFQDIVSFIRELYNEPENFIPLHEPQFIGNEKAYVLDAIDSTFVSSVGAYVDKFEKEMAKIAGTNYAVATVNGTAALHAALLVAGVKKNEEVITQPFTFVATANSITYTGADPVFVDVAQHTLSLSPEKLEGFLNEHAYLSNDGNCFNKTTGKRIAACLPMHTFGLPGRIDELNAICQQFNIPLVEDAAESLGSIYKAHHTGSFGLMGTFSFNGNKTVTSGGGGAVVTNDLETANHAKHLTTTAKARDGWQFGHDQVGYNYRMPNLNAAFACAQLEMLDHFVQNKRETAQAYADFFKESSYTFIQETSDAYSNYWLNSILVNDREERDALLDYANEQGIMARPAWKVLHHLPMYNNCFQDDLTNAEWLEQRIVHLPSSVRGV